MQCHLPQRQVSQHFQNLHQWNTISGPLLAGIDTQPSTANTVCLNARFCVLWGSSSLLPAYNRECEKKYR